MENHRYSLAKRGKKVECPACKQKRFVLYIDNETGKPLHSTVGRCDRENNCGRHYTPKQYFADNSISFDKRKEYRPLPKRQVEPKPMPSYIDLDTFGKSLKGYENNNFVKFLRNIVGDDVAGKAVEQYHVGTSKNGGTVFWQIDMSGNIHAGKIIVYGADGHRRKDVQPPVQWVHAIMKLPKPTQCFFGEHLLNDTAKPVAIVESEKTAVIASCYMPEFIWLACGGSDGLNPNKYECLRGRIVVLYPDAGMFDKWSEKAKLLQGICSFDVSDLVETVVTDDERKKGFDIADYLVKHPLSEFLKSADLHALNSTEGIEPAKHEPPKHAGSIEEISPKIDIQVDRTTFLDMPFDDFPDSEREPQGSESNNRKARFIAFDEQDIISLKTYFDGIDLPAAPVRLNSYTTLNDVRQFLYNHFATVEANIGNPTFLPYLHRLQELKQFIEIS